MESLGFTKQHKKLGGESVYMVISGEDGEGRLDQNALFALRKMSHKNKKAWRCSIVGRILA